MQQRDWSRLRRASPIFRDATYIKYLLGDSGLADLYVAHGLADVSTRFAEGCQVEGFRVLAR